MWQIKASVHLSSSVLYMLAWHCAHVTVQGQAVCFGWLVADGWCWFVLREKYCWLVVGGWFVLREKYCWLVADKPSEQAGGVTILNWGSPGCCMSVD
jgi:hypothetical protein